MSIQVSGMKRPRIGPLGAAGGLEGEDRAQPGDHRPRGHEGRLKQDVVVAVDIAAVLTVDDLRLESCHGFFQRRNQLDKAQGVEPLIGEAQRQHMVDAQDLAASRMCSDWLTAPAP